MAPASGLRIGDAEREATATGLREHYAHGRLTLDEFNERLDATFAAKTDTDLERITADLPHAGFRYPLPAASVPAAAQLTAPPGPWQYGSQQQSYQQQDYQQQGPQGSRCGYGRPGRSVVSSLLMLVLAIILLSSLTPFVLFGLTITRPWVIVFAIFAFGRKLLRRLFGFGTRVPRRRWPL